MLEADHSHLSFAANRPDIAIIDRYNIASHTDVAEKSVKRRGIVVRSSALVL